MSMSEPRLEGRLAAEDLSAKQYHFVKPDSTDPSKVVLCDSAGEKCLGILMNKPESGQMAEIALPGGGGKIKLDEAVAILQYITPSAAGQGEVADAAGEHVGAIAKEVGADADVIDVDVVAFEAFNSDV